MLELLQGGPGLTDWRHRLADGVVWERLDNDMFVVFSPLSGETHFLNSTAVWLLDLLREPGWHGADELIAKAAAEAEMPLDEVRSLLGDFWATFMDGGLVLRRSGQAVYA